MLDWDDVLGFGDYEFDKNLLTNFRECKLPIYQEAIKEFNSDSLFIENDAYDCTGRKLEGYYALKTIKHKDKSEFWKIFRRIEKEFEEE